jgi:Tol biopolymer transport system component
MGEVYRARDSRLGREVAIKVSAQQFTERFEREARLIGSLNHPNICSLFDVGPNFLVMELVEGPTLAERIAEGPLPLEEALHVAAQIADALEAAHEKGIVHRDLKPGNVKMKPDGVVKVLDFGLAKAGGAPEATSVDSPTISMAATQAGVILGTAAYMSPEQARGKVVDKRTDIWAFGAVLYEMVTGRQLFRGEDLSETLASVIMNDPDLDDVTPRVRRVLQRCLQKDPKKRLRDISGVAILLEEELPAPSLATKPPEKRWVWPAVAGVTLVSAAVLGVAWYRAHFQEAPLKPLIRLSADLGPDAVIGPRVTAAISPDGTRIVFPVRADGRQMLATRMLDQNNATLLAGTEEGSDPFFSPDSQWIGFFNGSKMQKISVQGGAAVALGDSSNARGASWGEDGTIVAELVNTSGLVRVPDSGGGAAQPLTQLKPGEATHRWPQFLPGGQAVVFTASNSISAFDEASIDALDLRTNRRKTLWRGGYFGRYLPTGGSRGYLVYIHQGTLFGAPFDPVRLELQGTPAPLLEDVAGDPTTGAGQLDFSRTGSLVYRSGKAGGRTWPVMWLDSSGKTQPLLAKPGTYYTPSISPDGQRLAVALESGKDLDIWVYEPQRGTMSRLTYTTQGALYPVWSPDGKYIVFGSQASAAPAIMWIRSDGAGEAQPLLESKNDLNPISFSADGRRLAYTQLNPETGFDLWTVTLDLRDPGHPKPGKPELFLRTPFNERDGVFSPDGRWMAYTSDESGTRELYVRPFPGPGGKWQISAGGAVYPRWPASGHTLFYETPNEDRIMAVDYTSAADSFSASKPRMWAALQMTDASGDVNLDVAPDGKRLAVFPAPDAKEGEKGSLHVTFLLNFFDELRRRVPTGK